MANEIPLYAESGGAFVSDLALASRTAAGALKLTATSLSFFGGTPVVLPASADQAVAVYATQTITNPPTQAEVQAINDGLVSVRTLVNALRAALIPTTGVGLIKGSA